MTFRALLLLSSVLLFVGCQKTPTDASSQTTPTASAARPAVDPSAGATISGTVSFTGAPPRAVSIDMSADGGCRGLNSSESLVVADGHLQNVFVYLEGGFTFAPSPLPVVVEQRGCKYVPHVIAVAVTQPVEFRNTDLTNHNIHGMPKANEAWNSSQPGQAPPMSRSFAHAETMIPVKCNQHPWMKMYINVSDSPFFAVTDAQGHFEFHGVPPGTYNLVFVHESLGKQSHSITVGSTQQNTMDVSFTQ